VHLLEISRRDLLGLGLATAAISVTTSALSGPSHAKASAPGRRQVHHHHPETAQLSTPGTSPDPPIIPRWAQRWPSPIYNIHDYSARCSRPAFARDAVVLTVDDGPHPTWTPRYLDLFEHLGVTATFCLIGANVAKHPRLVREIHERGHTVANHTWTHDEALTTRPRARIDREIQETNAAIHDACGVVVRQFRAPGGVWGPALFDALARFHMMPLGWNVDPRDWSRPGTATIERVMLTAGRHDIVLCHDGGGDRSETYAALRYVIPRWKRAGFQFVTLPSPVELSSPLALR